MPALTPQLLASSINENGRVFRSFGPNSGAESLGEVRWDLTLWEKARQEIIVPNNRKIAKLITSESVLVPAKYRLIFDKMLTHVYAFEKHCENPTFDYGEHRFPDEFAEVIDDVCLEAAAKDPDISTIREWLAQRVHPSGLPVLDGYLTGSVLRSPSEASDIDIILLSSDQSTGHKRFGQERPHRYW